MLLASNIISIESLWKHTGLGPTLQVSDLVQLAWKSVSTSSQVRLTVLIQTTYINRRLIHTYSETWRKAAATSSCRFKKVLYLKVYKESQFPYSSTRSTFSNWNKPNKITFSPFPLKLDHSAPKWIKMLLIGKENDSSSLGGSCAVYLVAQSCLTLWDPMDCSPPGSSVHRDSPGKNTGVGSHSFLQGIFLTQGSNPGLLHCRLILYHLSHQGTPAPATHKHTVMKNLMQFSVAHMILHLMTFQHLSPVLSRSALQCS